MTLLKITVLILSLVIGNFAFAKTNMNFIETKAAVYMLEKANRNYLDIFVQPNPNEICYPKNNVACVEFVAGSYPTNDQRLTAARACIGNFGLECAQFTAGSYPSFDQRIAAANACRGNLNMACAEFVAGSYPSTEQRLAAAIACNAADADCVKFAAGAYPSFDQRIAAAKACGGN